MRFWGLTLFTFAASALALKGCQDHSFPAAPKRPARLDQLTGPALQTVESSWNQLQQAPNNPKFWRKWSFATHANGLLEESLAAHIALESLDPRLGDHFRKAVVLEKLGRTSEAVATLQTLFDPSGTVDRRLAKILLDQGELERAFDAASKARDADPSDFGHLTVWCEIQMQRGQPGLIREALKSRLPEIQAPSWLHTLDTRAAEILGDPPPPYASTSAERVVYLPNVYLDPLLPWVRTREGDVERLRTTIKAGDDQKALAMSSRLVSERPEDPEIAAVHAGLLREAGRNPEAIRVLDRHRASLPAESVFWKNDAMCRIFAFAEGGPDAGTMLIMARESADRATTYGAGDLQCWKVSGIVAGQEENHVQAEQDFRKAASLARGNTQILLTLDAEMSRGRSGDWKGAIDALLPIERQYGMTIDGPLAKPVRRATIEALARAGFFNDAKSRVAALSKAGQPESAELARLVQEIENELSRFPSP
ncbi:MAG: hypothetical protein AAGK34_02465 [Planctomycetota bacterium]|jgi:tetratricopeptide (TPR) repeat protein|nr:MAG: tetratricopeptide repeat protein [Phycisphaeraceae bacterium]